MRMRIYYFRCYWPSNLLFVVRCVTYISNLKKIAQKLRSVLERQTNTQVNLHLSDAMNCIGQTTEAQTVTVHTWPHPAHHCNSSATDDKPMQTTAKNIT